MLYADTSALARAYFRDEPDHELLRALLFEGGGRVVTSELARLELASAVQSAFRAGRLSSTSRLPARIEADLREGGLVMPIRLRPRVVLPSAHMLLVEHRLRTLDAIHLAVALGEAPALADGEEVVFVTRDTGQAAAARACGLSVR